MNIANELDDEDITIEKERKLRKLQRLPVFLSTYEEAQDTMKEADIMINGLMIANEIMKLEIERLKKEKGSLISEAPSLQSSNDLKN